jgi:hypothetical protein
MTERDAPTNLSGFRSSVDDPRHRPDPYVLAKLSHELGEFARLAGEAGIDKDFIRRIRWAVYDGFQRLDALPRDDPFWEGTNRRPTFHKLPDLCDKLLGMNPGDERALWTKAAAYVVSFWNFDPALWLPFVAAGGLDASLPINAALYVDYSCGTDSVHQLVTLLDRTGLCPSALPILERLARSNDQFIKDWATKAGEGCQILVTRELSTG